MVGDENFGRSYLFPVRDHKMYMIYCFGDYEDDEADRNNGEDDAENC